MSGRGARHVPRYCASSAFSPSLIGTRSRSTRTRRPGSFRDDGPSFWIDCKDELDDPDTAAAVVAVIAEDLDAAGADGMLCVVRHDEV